MRLGSRDGPDETVHLLCLRLADEIRYQQLCTLSSQALRIASSYGTPSPALTQTPKPPPSLSNDGQHHDNRLSERQRYHSVLCLGVAQSAPAALQKLHGEDFQRGLSMTPQPAH